MVTHKKTAADAWADIFAKILAFFVVAFLLFAMWSILTAFIMVGWSWFVVPIFGAPLLSFQQAWGITLLTVSFRMLVFGRRVRAVR